MEIYNFDQVIPRVNTDCAKWDLSDVLFGSKDVLPMWVADMDFPVAKPITDALQNRINHELYGYSISEPTSTVEAIVQRMKRLYNWDVHPEWILLAPGVVPSLYSIIKSLTVPGDSVIHQDPVYYPFWSIIEGNGCHVANNPLKLLGEKYVINYEDLENKFKPIFRMGRIPNRVKAMILCHPHNPVGRVWTESELIRLGEIVVGNGAVMVSDEIHGEVLFNGHKHIPFASLSKEFEQNSITCIAPSKTFNLAGLGASAVIIPNPELRNNFKKTKKGFLAECNVLGMVAMEAAYRHGDEWLGQFLAYTEENLEVLVNRFEERIPRIRIIKPEGTYLVWMDCRDLGMNNEELANFFNKEARVGLDHGYVFGPTGEGFERINIACPRSLLVEALDRIERAVNSLG